MSELKPTKSQRKREAKRQAAEQSKREFTERVLSIDELTHCYRMGPHADMGWSGKCAAVMAGELLRLRGHDPDQLAHHYELEHVRGE